MTVPPFPPPKAVEGMQVCRVVDRMLPCACRARIIETWEGYGPQGVVLDAQPVAKGAYVVVQNKIGGQKAIPYEAKLHKGWRRYAAHVCTGKGNGK